MADKTFSLLAQLSLNDDAFKNSLKSVRENTKALIDGVEGVNGNLNEMRKALGVLNNTSFAGKSQEEIASIKKRIGELKEDMIDLKAQEKAMGMALVEVVPSALQGLTAIAEGVLGTAQLFGMSKENAEKLNSTMTQLIGISQALATIEQLRAERTIQIIGLKVKETLQTGYQTVANWANTTSVAANAASIQAQAIITSEATIAAKAAAAAQWLWNTAILANPIVAIIAAVAALTAGIYLLVKANSEDTDSIKKKAEAYDKLNSAIELNKGLNEQTISVLKAKGVSSSYIIQKEIDDLNQQKNSLNASYNAYMQLDEISEEQAKKQKENSDKLLEVLNKLQVKNAELAKAKQDEAKKADDDAKKTKSSYELLTDSISKQEGAIRNVLSTGGVVSPKMLSDLNKAYKEIERVNNEFDTMLKKSQGRDETKITSLKSITKVQVQSDKPVKLDTNLEVDKLNAYTKKVIESGNIQKTALDKSNRVWNSLKENIKDSQFLVSQFGNAINGLTTAFQGLFNGTEGAFHSFVGSMLSGIQQIINGLLAQAIASMIAGESKKGLLGLITASVGIGLLTALWYSKVPKFTYGGIVPGSVYSGDRVPVMANSGEMILNAGQQTNLFNLLNYGSINGNANEVQFKIKGSDLYGVLNNYSRKINAIR